MGWSSIRVIRAIRGYSDEGMKPLNILIIAGEVSGDMHAAGLVKAIKRRMPDATFFGIGGDHLRAAGVEIHYDVKDMAVMGFWEILHRLSFFRGVFYRMLDLARKRKPDAVILVDYPGFNLRFAGKAHEMGLKVIYYVCPQVWAWNRARIPKMAEVVDRLITIFPFEGKHFDGTGLCVDFAGHPLVDEARQAWSEHEVKLPWKGEPHVALLPGSRGHVIHHILPVMWQAACLVEDTHPDASFIIPTPSEEVESIVRRTLASLSGGPTRWEIVTGNTRQVLRQAKAAIVASGTATIETALMRCPMIVVYKMAPLSYMLGKRLVSLDHIGMVNIVAGKSVCPEFIQDAATPEALAHTLNPLLRDTPERATMVEDLRGVAAALGPGGASDRAAESVIQELAPPA